MCGTQVRSHYARLAELVIFVKDTTGQQSHLGVLPRLRTLLRHPPGAHLLAWCPMRPKMVKFHFSLNEYKSQLCADSVCVQQQHRLYTGLWVLEDGRRGHTHHMQRSGPTMHPAPLYHP